MLTVIEQQERLTRMKVDRPLLYHGNTGRRGESERGRNSAGNERGIT